MYVSIYMKLYKNTTMRKEQMQGPQAGNQSRKMELIPKYYKETFWGNENVLHDCDGCGGYTTMLAKTKTAYLNLENFMLC